MLEIEKVRTRQIGRFGLLLRKSYLFRINSLLSIYPSSLAGNPSSRGTWPIFASSSVL